MEEGETLEHFHHRFSDYLGVSVKIMRSVYNRHDLHKKHKGTLKAANSGKVAEADTQVMGEMERKMAAALQPEVKVQRVNMKKCQARVIDCPLFCLLWPDIASHIVKWRRSSRSGLARLEVLVKWTLYSAEFNTWEDFTGMGNALECVQDFLLKAQLFS